MPAAADVLCAGLPTLLGAARTESNGDIRALGVIRAEAGDRVLFAYVDAFGATAYRPLAVDLPAPFRPRASGTVLVTPGDLASNPSGLVESRLLHLDLPEEFRKPADLRHIVTAALPRLDQPTLFVACMSKQRELTDAETNRIVSGASQLLDWKESADGELERLRRLEAVERLLPIFFQVLDVREIFGRLSAITKDVVPHDFASVGVFNDSLTEIAVYAQTWHDSGKPYIGPMPYPPSQTGVWQCRVVPDLRDHPVDSVSDYAAKAGGRSSIRVGLRLGDRIHGALNFTALEPSLYSALDLTIARRVADYIALAISHHRLAEEGRKAAALEERNAKLEVRVRSLTDELDSKTGYRRMAGASKAWQQVLTQATKVAATDTTALLLGESGTGKEVVARFLHRASPRSNGPFIALNCAALPEQLLEAELFGYERGAYTGATQSKPGQLEQASGGTLFLDEVGEMSPSAQAKFLRVLQEREFQRLGGTRVLRTDARIIAATNLNLQHAMTQGRFREDLFYRLNVFAIQLPPLRDRREDILPLSEAFLAEFAQRFGRPPAGVSRDAVRMLTDHHWPGNVRELRNSLERAAILCEGGLITPEHLSFATAVRPQASIAQAAAVAAAPPLENLPSVERAMIEQALQNARFNKSKAARSLGLTRQQLYVRMRRYGLE